MFKLYISYAIHLARWKGQGDYEHSHSLTRALPREIVVEALCNRPLTEILQGPEHGMNCMRSSRTRSIADAMESTFKTLSYSDRSIEPQ